MQNKITYFLFIMAFFFLSCQTKQELAAPTPALVGLDRFIGHWAKATVIYNTNIEYIISKADTTVSVNEIVSCKGDDCSKVKPSNLTYKAYYDKTKNVLHVFKKGDYLDYVPFSYDNISGWLFVDGFSYLKKK